VDLSECSRHALDHALAMARWYGSAVTVLYVMAEFPAGARAAPVEGFSPISIAPARREEVLASVRQFADVDGAAGIRLDVLIRGGDVVAEILAQATAMPADLLTIGTHGRSGFERLVLGSVAEKVLRRAECPVLSVPPRAPDVAASAPVHYQRIVCPVDFYEPSMDALRYAISLAQEANAHLTVMHVMEYGMHEWPELYDTVMANTRVSLEDFRKECQRISRERLELAVPEDVRRCCTVETVLAEGKPYREILHVADQRRSDLIVIGVRGRGALDLMIFGSTAQHVVRMATCPVLTVRGT
jgi:nucleotide-binding universal stress UspA family protein